MPDAWHRPPALSVSTIERRLSGLIWGYRERGIEFDHKNRPISTVLARIKRKHARRPVQYDENLSDDILAVVATLPYNLRGLRYRAILLIRSAGGLKRFEIVNLDEHKYGSRNSVGWTKIMEQDVLPTLNAKTGMARD